MPGFARQLSKVGPDAKYEASSAKPAVRALSIDAVLAMPDQGELGVVVVVDPGRREGGSYPRGSQCMPDQGDLRRPMSLAAGALEAVNHLSFEPIEGGSEAPTAENRRASAADDDRSSRHSADRRSVGSSGLRGVLGTLADVDTAGMGFLERMQCADTAIRCCTPPTLTIPQPSTNSLIEPFYSPSPTIALGLSSLAPY